MWLLGFGRRVHPIIRFPMTKYDYRTTSNSNWVSFTDCRSLDLRFIAASDVDWIYLIVQTIRSLEAWLHRSSQSRGISIDGEDHQTLDSIRFEKHGMTPTLSLIKMMERRKSLGRVIHHLKGNLVWDRRILKFEQSNSGRTWNNDRPNQKRIFRLHLCLSNSI